MKGASTALGLLILSAFAAFLVCFALSHELILLNPKGLIGLHEKELMRNAIVLMLIVVIPVFTLAIFFAIRYNEKRPHSMYNPNFENAKMDELIWWAIPFEIILVLGALCFSSTHELDPKRAIASDVAPIEVQVVALNWKWLFIYPEQNIASVNYLLIPEDTPIDFHITSDGVMNSFWIPQLGGQIYAMAGMSTNLHLIAEEPGEYAGSSANFSGDGFSGMRFVTKAVSKQDFDAWVASTTKEGSTLTKETFKELSKESKNNPATFYSSIENGLYNNLVNSFSGMTENNMHAH